MPYREPDTSHAADARLLPQLRAGSDPIEGVRRPLIEGDSSLEVPWIYLTLQGSDSPLDEGAVRHRFDDLGSAFQTAADNLDAAPPRHREVDSVHVFEGEYAAEMLLSDAFRRRLHRELKSNELYVSIPERGVLLAISQRLGASPLYAVRDSLQRTRAEPITARILRLERGRLRRGRAPAQAALPPEPAANDETVDKRAHTSQPALRPLPPTPGWVPKSLGAQLLLAAALIGGLTLVVFGRAALRGSSSERVTIPALPRDATRRLEAATDSFQERVDALVVVERHAGDETSLIVSGGADDDMAIVVFAERMKREGIDWSGGRLGALEGHLSAAQAEPNEHLLRRLETRISEDIRQAGGPSVPVRFIVGPE